MSESIVAIHKFCAVSCNVFKDVAVVLDAADTDAASIGKTCKVVVVGDSITHNCCFWIMCGCCCCCCRRCCCCWCNARIENASINSDACGFDFRTIKISIVNDDVRNEACTIMISDTFCDFMKEWILLASLAREVLFCNDWFFLFRSTRENNE